MIGTFPSKPRIVSTAYGSAAGSAGPFESITPAGRSASTSAAELFAGSTRTRNPYHANRRSVLRLTP